MTSTFVVSGAYDTDEFGLLHRVVFWMFATALVVFQPAILERGLARVTPASPAGAWLSTLGAVLVAIPVIAVELHLLKSTPLLPRAADPWIEFIPFVGAPVMVVAGFVLFLRFAWERRHLDTGARPAPSADDATQARGAIGPETLYVRSQDHYLEITTEGGRRFIRGRLADLKSGNDLLGFAPHRSWWVADRAIETCKRDGRDLRLVLSDGTQVPVSRSCRTLVRARGLI
ncbi:LytTR family DNA-binding domain-containing protein [Maricaulis sp.]|uniref:LytTR family DNA-binding domain-containing protein n=1 Tax=Maricaulis sp. TaxID=1486257 RepID=UPI003A90C6AC